MVALGEILGCETTGGGGLGRSSMKMTVKRMKDASPALYSRIRRRVYRDAGIALTDCPSHVIPFHAFNLCSNISQADNGSVQYILCMLSIYESAEIDW